VLELYTDDDEWCGSSSLANNGVQPHGKDASTVDVKNLAAQVKLTRLLHQEGALMKFIKRHPIIIAHLS